MIFKTALKYKIYEWCLDTLVNKLIKNFKVLKLDGVRINVKDLRSGMHISTIILDMTGWDPIFFYDCKIISTYKITLDDYDEWIDPTTGNIRPAWSDPDPLWDVQFTANRTSGDKNNIVARDSSYNNHVEVHRWNTSDGTNELEFIL